jgi:hypothetical protein
LNSGINVNIMKSNIARRTFIIRSGKAGLISITGSFFPGSGVADIIHESILFYQRKNQGDWSVRKEVYVSSPEPRTAISMTMNYIGNGFKREERRALIKSSDWTEKPRKRTSTDNGRTWSEWQVIDEQKKIQGDYTLSGGEDQGGTGPYDPVAGKLIKPVFQRIVKGNPQVAMSEIWKGNRLFSDHGFYQLSEDDGLTWGKAFMLKYEEGPDFDPANWGDKRFFRTNEMYIGNVVVLKNGSVIITATIPVPFMDEEDKNMPSIFPNNYREGCVAGAICFIGRWNAELVNYDWKLSKPVFVPRRISTRGLVELNISELSTGKLMMIARGSNSGLDPEACPGRRWFSVSDDGGFTWSDIKDIRFDTGEQFYSPASISSAIRSSENNSLYWIGNISEKPVNGNSPRYPLVIIEVDEEKFCFRKNTLTVIDDRDPLHDSESVQLSNFSILENRETHEIELYLTRYGEHGDGPDTWSADTYKYTLQLKTD